jgi:hypothetical protein
MSAMAELSKPTFQRVVEVKAFSNFHARWRQLINDASPLNAGECQRPLAE